jgi:hypothetical protein
MRPTTLVNGSPHNVPLVSWPGIDSRRKFVHNLKEYIHFSIIMSSETIDPICYPLPVYPLQGCGRRDFISFNFLNVTSRALYLTRKIWTRNLVLTWELNFFVSLVQSSFLVALLSLFPRQRQLIKTTHKARVMGGKLTSPGEVNHENGPAYHPTLDDDLVSRTVTSMEQKEFFSKLFRISDIW